MNTKTEIKEGATKGYSMVLEVIDAPRGALAKVIVVMNREIRLQVAHCTPIVWEESEETRGNRGWASGSFKALSIKESMLETISKILLEYLKDCVDMDELEKEQKEVIEAQKARDRRKPKSVRSCKGRVKAKVFPFHKEEVLVSRPTGDPPAKEADCMPHHPTLEEQDLQLEIYD